MCAVCGLPAADGATLRAVLRTTFTDHAALRAPDSGVVCAACDWYMAHQELRRQSWWLTPARAEPIERGEMATLLRAHLDDPPNEDGYYLFTATRRKHLALYAPLNLAGARLRRVRFETDNVDVDADWFVLRDAALTLRQHHTWEEIETDHYRAHALAGWHDPGAFVAARDLVRPWRRAPRLALIRFINVATKGANAHVDPGAE